MSNHTTGICIIGLGPRGLSVLERLCAAATDRTSQRRNLRIHLIDPHVLAGSRVWHVDQAPELLMNTVATQVTMFADESVQCAGPVVAGPSLYEWARFITLIDAFDDIPDRMRHEARRLGPNSYPSRAFYGQYLAWVLSHLIRTAPANVSIDLYPQQAVDLVDAEDGTQVITLSDGQRLHDVTAVVLTQGHIPPTPTDAETAMSTYAGRHGLTYLPPGNPADAQLDILAPGQPTALRGLGLTFFDYLPLLTVGRGGTFTRNTHGQLTYHRSGREPRLIAGSRRGLAYHARGENQKGAFGRHIPLFLTKRVITGLRARANSGEPVDFRTDVWPLVDHEVRAVYYSTLISERLCTCDAGQFLPAYVTLHADGGADSRSDRSDPFAYITSDAEKALLARFGVTDNERWDWHHIAHPHADREFSSNADFRTWLLSYLDNDVREARRGNVLSPTKAALDVMRDLRNEIRLIVDHGGLSGDSYRDDLQAWYTPLNAFVSIGPPTLRIEEMIALIDSGVLTVVGPDMTVDCPADHQGFLVRSATVPGSTWRATALIEARLPEPDIRRTSDALLRNLLARGECGPHRIPIRGGGRYETGGLAVTERPYHLLDAAGTPHPCRFAFGIPTETVHWATAAGIRPGVNSVILSDADAVAHASLLAAARPSGNPSAWPRHATTPPKEVNDVHAGHGHRSAVARMG